MFESNQNSEIPPKNQEIISRINKIISEINRPDLDLQVYKNCSKLEILEIYEKYLLKLKKFLIYYEEESKWKLLVDKEEYKSWGRDDGNFIVRKCEKQDQVNVNLLRATMGNMKEAPKWNPMLSIFFILIFSSYFNK